MNLTVQQAEQLSRTRRNQQRCRERKRVHVAELESQVEILQAKIRQCEPCASQSPPEHESALDTASRENAARRDLLLALGFGNETQTQFVESAAKRQAVYTILQRDHDHTTSSETPGDQLAKTQLSPSAQIDVQSARVADGSADLRSSSAQAMDSLNTNIELMDIAIDQQANMLYPSVSISTHQSYKTFNNTSPDRGLVILARDA